ncbi:hypothetical protein JOB18_031101 [Solea senegalensis]|uniref:Uncharacterized protein n=1 Tax=Solea senegalensis TaxID=28829 RepID=A0AAV6RF10_SOLSE|nr:hypothetical protein JOB18_031101 [Solea senegalensis]
MADKREEYINSKRCLNAAEEFKVCLSLFNLGYAGRKQEVHYRPASTELREICPLMDTWSHSQGSDCVQPPLPGCRKLAAKQECKNIGKDPSQ